MNEMAILDEFIILWIKMIERWNKILYLLIDLIFKKCIIKFIEYVLNHKVISLLREQNNWKLYIYIFHNIVIHITYLPIYLALKFLLRTDFYANEDFLFCKQMYIRKNNACFE